MAARIKAARELGDLKENADYHIAKDDQGHLEARIRRLRERLRKATVVESTDAAPDSFAFGRTAEVLDESSGKVNTWTLVGATEADFGQGKLSIESPVGRALQGQGDRRDGHRRDAARREELPGPEPGRVKEPDRATRPGSQSRQARVPDGSS